MSREQAGWHVRRHRNERPPSLRGKRANERASQRRRRQVEKESHSGLASLSRCTCYSPPLHLFGANAGQAGRAVDKTGSSSAGKGGFHWCSSRSSLSPQWAPSTVFSPSFSLFLSLDSSPPSLPCSLFSTPSASTDRDARQPPPKKKELTTLHGFSGVSGREKGREKRIAALHLLDPFFISSLLLWLGSGTSNPLLEQAGGAAVLRRLPLSLGDPTAAAAAATAI